MTLPRGRLLVAALALITAACTSASTATPVVLPSDLEVPPPADAWIAEVERVVDGDTLWATSLGGHPDAPSVGTSVRLRLLRIDTPELARDGDPAQCLAEAARDHLADRLSHGEPVRLAWDVERQDRFGRELVHLWDEQGLWVNGAMLLEGYANVVTYPPNVAHDEEVRRLERLARDAGAGLWSAC